MIVHRPGASRPQFERHPLLCSKPQFPHLKNERLGNQSSHRGTVEMNLTRKHELWVRSLASLNGLRIRHCQELWCRS